MRTQTRVVEVETEHHLQFLDITDEVTRSLADSGVQNGFAVVFSRHTTAGIRINEHEPLLLEVKDRTTISSNTTLPCDEPDYEAALTSYRLALRDHPTDLRVLQNMAIAFTKTARLDEAIADGTPTEVQANQAVIDAYLGLSH